jgi:hypothetical protein
VDESKSRSDDRADWESSADDRKYFAARYPDTKLPTLLEFFHQWQAEFKKDPTRAAENARRRIKRSNPFGKVAVPSEVKEEMPSDLWETAKHDWQRDADVRAAVRTAEQRRRDEEDYERTKFHRQHWKELTGKPATAPVLKQLRAIDEALHTDTDKAVRMLAEMYGAPVSQSEQQEWQAQAEYQQQHALAENFIAQLKQSNRLPPDYAQLEDRVADVLMHAKAEGFPVSDPANWEYFLDFAIRQARTEKALETEVAQARTEAAERSRRASRSVNGAPSPGARQMPARTRGGNDELEDDVRNAVYTASNLA